MTWRAKTTLSAAGVPKPIRAPSLPSPTSGREQRTCARASPPMTTWIWALTTTVGLGSRANLAVAPRTSWKESLYVPFSPQSVTWMNPWCRYMSWFFLFQYLYYKPFLTLDMIVRYHRHNYWISYLQRCWKERNIWKSIRINKYSLNYVSVKPIIRSIYLFFSGFFVTAVDNCETNILISPNITGNSIPLTSVHIDQCSLTSVLHPYRHNTPDQTDGLHPCYCP